MSWSRPVARWLLRILLGCLLLMVLLMVVPGTRTWLLRSAGWALVAQDGIQPADIIVVSIDADGEGVLGAADLVHAGVATRVALFPDPPDRTDREFLRRGLPYSNRAAIAIIQLHALGVESVELIPASVSGTSDEGAVLSAWCAQRGFKTLIFVSTADHSRRARRTLARSLRGSGTRPIVRYSAYSEFDPDRWWRTRRGIRIEIVEAEKLLIDAVLHPLG